MSKPIIPRSMLIEEPTKRQRSIRQEDRFAKELGGKRNKGSGSWKFRPGDAKTTHELLETKTTTKQSYRLHTDELKQITEEASRSLRTPLFGVTFEQAPFGVEKDWVVVPLSVWRTIQC